MSAGSTPYEKTVTWTDPSLGLSLLPRTDGIDFIKKMASGETAGPPIGAHIGMKITEVDEGAVTVDCHPEESHYNPLGTVHGGLMCTLLDSALGCAVHTTLPQGTSYTSIEIKVNCLRPVTAASGGYSQPTPSPSRSRWEAYPGSPRWTGAAPASRAAVQFLK